MYSICNRTSSFALYLSRGRKILEAVKKIEVNKTIILKFMPENMGGKELNVKKGEQLYL